MLNFIKKMTNSSKKDSGCCGVEISEVIDEATDSSNTRKTDPALDSCCGTDSQNEDSCCN